MILDFLINAVCTTEIKLLCLAILLVDVPQLCEPHCGKRDSMLMNLEEMCQSIIAYVWI